MKLLKKLTDQSKKQIKISYMDTGNIILFLKEFSFVRLVGTGIVLRVFIAIIDGIFGLQINEVENFNFYIFGLALVYTILWMFNKSYSEEEE